MWIEVVPTPAAIGETTHLVLNWGPWERHVDTVLFEAGVVLRTGKAADADGVSRTLNFQSAKPLYVLSGAGRRGAPDERVLDIRAGWTLTRPERQVTPDSRH